MEEEPSALPRSRGCRRHLDAQRVSRPESQHRARARRAPASPRIETARPRSVCAHESQETARAERASPPCDCVLVCEISVSPRGRVSRVVRLVDDYEVVTLTRHWNLTCSAKPLERHEIRAGAGRRQRVSPHRGERGGCDDQDPREPVSDRRRDKSLAHADIVAQECAAKLFQRVFNSSDRGLLMGFQSNRTQLTARSFRSEDDLRNSGANDRRRR